MQGKLTEVRTPKGRMVGTLDARTGTLHIKDGRRITIIEVPKAVWTSALLQETGASNRFA